MAGIVGNRSFVPPAGANLQFSPLNPGSAILTNSASSHHSLNHPYSHLVTYFSTVNICWPNIWLIHRLFFTFTHKPEPNMRLYTQNSFIGRGL